MCSIYAWLVSPDGTAIGTWLASFAGIVALGIALVAYFGDIGRARGERRHADQRLKDERQRIAKLAYDERSRFVDTCAQVVQGALDVLSACSAAGEMFTEATHAIELGGAVDIVRPEIEAIVEVVEGLRTSAPPDASFVIALSRSAHTMREFLRIQIDILNKAGFLGVVGNTRVKLEASLEEIRERHPVHNPAEW